MLDRIRAFITRQPIASTGAAITGLVIAGIGVLNAFAPGTVTDAQIADIAKSLAGLWVALGLIWPMVTPTRAPKVKEGTDVEVVTPGDAPNRTTTV